MTSELVPGGSEELARELRNFQEIASQIKPRPGELPKLEGFDVYGETIPLRGTVGGDHVIYLDFKQRYDLDARITQAIDAGRPEIAAKLTQCKSRAGIVVADVSGHRATDAMLAAMLHQAFLLGSIYELDIFGEITKRLFENLNTRFYNSSSVHKFITLIYGEITEDARFRFLSAAHPTPVVFSRLHDRFMEVGQDAYTTCPPLGTMPSWSVIDRKTTQSVLGFKDEYPLNEWTLMGAGDILLLYTDGLLDHAHEGVPYFPTRLEAKIRELADRSAQDIVRSVKEDLLEFAEPTDDISLVLIKRDR